MKRIIAALALAVSLAALSACGAPQTNLQPMEPVAESEPMPEAELTASESDAQAMPQEAPASDSNAVPAEEPDEEEPADSAAYEAALACVGRPVEELYAAIGEPEGSQYAASCEEDDAEDGMLFYDGFYIWTLRTETEEVVRAVYTD